MAEPPTKTAARGYPRHPSPHQPNEPGASSKTSLGIDEESATASSGSDEVVLYRGRAVKQRLSVDGDETIGPHARANRLHTHGISGPTGGQFSVLGDDLYLSGLIDSDGNPVSDTDGDAQSCEGSPGHSTKPSISCAPHDSADLEGSGKGADFDLMDRERPSIHYGSGPHAVELANLDHDLELPDAWARNRQKKRMRNIQREEQRAQGLLRGSKKRIARSNSDVDCAQLRGDLLGFLSSDKDSLTLQPMNKKSRKAIHGLANVLGMKSRSKGTGVNRQPSLSRSKSTCSPDLAMRRMDAFLGKNFPSQYSGPRTTQRDRALGSSGTALGPRRGHFADAVHKDGDLVGALAPQLGDDNKGMSMLKKMGWSHGSGLGAQHNRGGLFPVAQVVKSSRKGLV